MPEFEENARALDALAQRWANGDRSVFDAIVTATEGELRAFALSRTWMVNDAEEAIQSAYVIAFERMSDYEPRGTFQSWLKGMVRNRLLELNRERKREHHDDLDQALDQAWEESATHESEERLRRRLNALQECMQKIDARSRAILERHHLEGLELNELAQRYRKPRQTIARFLFTIRNRLRDCIEQRIAEDGSHA